MPDARMRVLHIGKFFPPYPGGIERYCAELAANQAAHGVSTAMLAHATPGSHRSTSLRVNDVEVTLAACHGQFLYAPISPAFPRLLSRAIRRFGPDVLHLHMPNTSAFWALLSPAARRLPWIVHWHADIPLDSRKRSLRMAYRSYRPWEQALLKRARAIVATSQSYLDASDALAPWRDKVRVVPLGIAALAQSSALGAGPSALWPGAGLRLLAVGRLSYYKGFDVLLRALADVPQAQLLLIGSGECDAALRAHAQDLRVAERVQFAGHVDDATLVRAYAQANVFCLPSTERAEAFGLVLLEAMRAELPTIASNIPGSGVGFVVREGETGLLVPPGDVAALAAAIRKLAADESLRRRLGAAGKLRWHDVFTLDRSAEQVMALYAEILGPILPRATAASET
jgi:glycosyltransferase involved in cell wall biosynthesis